MDGNIRKKIVLISTFCISSLYIPLQCKTSDQSYSADMLPLSSYRPIMEPIADLEAKAESSNCENSKTNENGEIVKAD